MRITTVTDMTTRRRVDAWGNSGGSTWLDKARRLGHACQSMHEGSITIRISANVHEIERLNRLIRQFGELHDIPSRALYSVNLALDEVVSNVVLYGYEEGEESAEAPITVHAEIKGQELMASVEDAGRQFDPLSLPVPDLSAPLDSRQIGGLGIHLMRSLMDHVEYRRENDRNRLTMRKRVR